VNGSSDVHGAGYCIGVDIGGTFTDAVIVAPDGVISSGKASSTPHDFSIGFFRAIGAGAETLGIAEYDLLAATTKIAHGTTIGINALVTGTRRTGIALTEPSGGSDLQGISTRARRDGDSYVVRGTKMWITNARHANPLPVLVKTDPQAEPRHRGMSILLVEQGLPGYSVTRDLGKLGYKGPETCEVVLDDVRVPAECLLGGVEGRGLQQALSALECGRINIAARAVGVAAEATDAALRYTNDRHAFGQPIAQFQAVQLKLADMATSVQAARLMTYWAASKLDSGQRADVETGMAKLFASETAVTCSLDSMRLHGAYGYSTELDIERLYRDAPLMAIGEGTNDILRTVIARGLSRSLNGEGR
jgi:alkylation response protein AidB-like acyl-CoA dehydrogenase